MTKRSRAYEAGSVEVGSVETRSSITKSIFFANRVDGAFVCNQIDAATASRSGKGRQSEPARTPRAARLSQARPDRASQGEPGHSASPSRTRCKVVSVLSDIVIDMGIRV